MGMTTGRCRASLLPASNFRTDVGPTLIFGAKSSHPEAGRSDARKPPVDIHIQQRSITGLPGERAGFIPEKIEAGTLNLVEQLLIGTLVGSALLAFCRAAGRGQGSQQNSAGKGEPLPASGLSGVRHE